VLLERDGAGHAENFAPVQIRHSSASWNDGEIVDVTIVAVEDGSLVGAPE
jgi:hypothetical protein